MADEHLNIEQQTISIFLSDKQAVSHWLSTSINHSFFDEAHQNILSAITYAHNNGVQLTRDAYRQFLSEYKKLTPAQIAAQMTTYGRCLMSAADKSGLPILLDRIRTAYTNRKTASLLNEYNKKREKVGVLGANRELIEKLMALEADTQENVAQFVELAGAKDKFMSDLLERRNNPAARLTCGIDEIDDTMNVGFKNGHLTLFSADVGSFKTTMMVNVGLNIHKLHQQNILYIPLEMPSEEIFTKIVGRELGIDMHKIEHSEKLTEPEIKQISDEFDKWHNMGSSFAVLDMAERTKVSTIRREIEKRISYFKPRVVIVDYADNLVPDISRAGRNDLELNDMLEDMRKMGKALGFSIVSAAQLARDALKKVQDQQNGKQTLSSTDIRGGQVYTANADTVYAQLRDPALPNEQLIFFAIKARHGKLTFGNGRNKTILRVRPEIALIESPNVIDTQGLPQDADVLDMLNQQPSLSDMDDDQPF
jgi:replicative DNA helicase